MALHYAPASTGGRASCGLRSVPAERLTDDLDAAGCGNCLSSLPWRSDKSRRDYKADYERFYGPGGFLDRAGQTTPASATTAPQARAAMERVVKEELERVAAMGVNGAGANVLMVAVRSSAELLMRSADLLVRHAVSEAAEGTVPGGA